MKIASLVLMVFFLLLFGCSDNEQPVTASPVPVDYSQDYFPFSTSYEWTYSTNAGSDSGKSYTTFQMKLDTHQFRRGQFMSIKMKLDTGSQWGALYGVKDSAGTVYILGDNPPEIAFPIFKHSYAAGEGTAETISINGTSYATIRVPVLIGPQDTLFLWLSKGIGLVKEMSNQGKSFFSDNNSAKNVHIESVLTKVKK